MRTRHALAIGTLAAATTLAMAAPQPTLAALNDVVTIEIGLSAWRPLPPTASTTGQPSVTAPAADDLFAPLIAPAPTGGAADTLVPPTAPPTASPQPDDGTEPGTAGGGTQVAEPATGDPVPEPTVEPEPGTTVCPVEDTPSVTGAEGGDAGDGATPTSPDPTSDG